MSPPPLPPCPPLPHPPSHRNERGRPACLDGVADVRSLQVEADVRGQQVSDVPLLPSLPALPYPLPLLTVTSAAVRPALMVSRMSVPFR